MKTKGKYKMSPSPRPGEDFAAFLEAVGLEASLALAVLERVIRVKSAASASGDASRFTQARG